MATKRSVVDYRRKREQKTNYHQRRRQLSSTKPRLDIRRYANSIMMQIIAFEPKGDKVLCAYTSTKLKKEYGWSGHTGNICAAYLTGLAIAKNSEAKDVHADFGFQRSVKGSTIYAAIKGAIDGGIQVVCDKKMFPKQEQLDGKFLKRGNDIIAKIKEQIMDAKK